MKIIYATTNQSDPKYGLRAGKQCMSNCFLFLHSAFLTSIENVLQESVLDLILDEGRRLDIFTMTLLQKSQSKPIPEFRLSSEIPNNITSQFGSTHHILSKHFNGTLDTQVIDDQVYFGIIDFLLYAKEKKGIKFFIVTVGVISRAVIINKNVFFIFDPHSSYIHNNATLCITDDFVDVYHIITNLITDGFYYEATFVYFLNTNDLQSLSMQELDLLTFQSYKDPDVSLDIPIEKISTPQKRKKTIIERLSEDHSITDKKSKHRNTINIKEHYNLFSSLEYYRPTLLNLTKIMNDISEKSPTLIFYVSKNHKKLSFANEFIWNRVFNLLCNIIDNYTFSFDITDIKDPEKYKLEEKKRLDIFYSYFSPFKNFSKSLENAIDACQTNYLDIIHIYNNYLCSTHISKKIEQILLTKFITLVNFYANKHNAYIQKWLDQLLQNLPTDPNQILQYVHDYISTKPIDSNMHFICLSKNYIRNIALTLNKKRQELISTHMSHIQIFKTLYNYIQSIGTRSTQTKGPNLLSINNKTTEFFFENEHLPDVSVLSKSKQEELIDILIKKIFEIKEDYQNNLLILLNDKHNNISTGFLPVDSLSSMLKQIARVLFDLKCLSSVNLNFEKTLHSAIERLYDNIHYILHGTIIFSLDNLLPFTISLRNNYDDFYKNNLTNNKAHEILLAIENIISNSKQPLSNTDRDMIKEQLNQVTAMETDDTFILSRISELNQKLLSLPVEEKAVYMFVEKFSSHDVPSIETVKKLVKLSDLLKIDQDLRKQLYDKLQLTLYLYLTDLINNIEVKIDYITTILFIIELFPDDKFKHEFLECTIVFKQLCKKYKQNMNIEELNDILIFINNNSSKFKSLIQQPFGHDFEKLFIKLKHNYDEKIIEKDEILWTQRVKNIKIITPQIIQELINTAPSQKILLQFKPILDEKLQLHMEELAKQEALERKRRIEDIQENIISFFKRIIQSLKNLHFQSLATMDFKSLENIILLINNRDDILIKFNHLIIIELKDIEKKFSILISNVIEKILQNESLKDIELKNDLYDSKIQSMLKMFLNLFITTTLCIEDTKIYIKKLLTHLSFLNDIQLSKNKEIIFSNSLYIDDYMTYINFLKKLEDIYNNMEKLLINKMDQINLEIQNKHNISHDDLFKDIVFPDIQIPQFSEIAFTIVAQEKVTMTKTGIKDLTNQYNIRIKAKLDTYNLSTSSFKISWSEFVYKHKMIHDKIKIDFSRMISDPIDTIQNLEIQAYHSLSYIDGEKLLNWLKIFLHEMIKFSFDAMKDFGSDVLHFDYKILPQLEQSIISKHTEIENKVIINEMLETVQDKDKLLTFLSQLDPKRMAGGLKQYQIYSEKIKMYEFQEQLIKYEEILRKKYFDILHNIKTFYLGFDFSTQLRQIDDLIIKFKNIHSKENIFEKFPITAVSLQRMNTTNYLTGLTALRHYILFEKQFFQSFFIDQPLIFKDSDYIPFTINENIAKNDTILRLQITNEKHWLQIHSVFDTQMIVNVKGQPIEFCNVFLNIVFKYFALHHENIKHHDPKNSVVSTRYKYMMISHNIVSLINQFWTTIYDFDIGPYLRQENLIIEKDSILIMNLKIITYVLTQSWNSIQTESNENATIIPLQKFIVFMTACFPEYIYGILTTSIDQSINTLIYKIDKDELFNRFMIYQNPPTISMEDMKTFCLDTNIWIRSDLKKLTWDTNFFTQICGKFSKFFIYLLAFLMIPEKILILLWNQFKPHHFAKETFSTLIYSLCKEYSNLNILKSIPLNPHEAHHLKTGEEIFSKFSLEEASNNAMNIFLNNDFVLDYILFSFVSKTQMTFCGYIDTLLNYILVMRQLENISTDPDFQNISQNLNYDLDYILIKSWTNNPIEQSFFSIQLKKIVQYLQTDRQHYDIPLIIYNFDNTLHSIYFAPNEGPGQKFKFYLNDFFNYTVTELPKTELINFVNIPTNTQFLSSSPPPKETQKKLHTVYKSQKHKKVTFSDDVAIIPSTESARDSLTIYKAYEPVTKSQPVIGLIPKEDSLILSNETTGYLEKTSNSNVETALDAINTTKNKLRTLNTTLTTAVTKMKSLYL